jgi:hypothetical protein
MVSRNAVLQDHFIILAIEIRWFRPPQVVHLFYEGTLAQDLNFTE